jgi:CubicO group peptidase (beta-lactamase class C family)
MEKLMKTNPMLCILLLTTVLSVSAQTNVETFDNYADAARLEWKVPGMSIAIVKDGKVVLAKGYGVRELGKNDAVDADTLFGAMSTTKAMTVAALAMLVDEGKISWDDKVVKQLPEFRVADPYVTSELRIRDLLTHNGGIGNADFLWAWTPELSTSEIIDRMQYARPAYPFRGGYTYQNIMYAVAGEVIRKASGMPWERFVTERLFVPLAMMNTYPNYRSSTGYKNRSSSHFEVDGKTVVIPEMTADPIAPAGAVWSTANDIGKWVAFMLGDGSVNGKVLIKPATFRTILSPQAIVPPGQFYPTVSLTKPHWTTYGFGWFQHDYRGEMVNFHTGSLAGRTAIIGLIPDRKMGIYIFGNTDHAEVRHALMYKAFDMFAFSDNAGRDWSKEMKTMYDGLEADGKKQNDAQLARRNPNTKPSLPLSSYAGRYSDPFYGDMDVALVNGKLRLTIGKGARVADVEHWHYDTFQTKWQQRWLGDGLITFQLNPVSGEVASMSLGGAHLRRVVTGK